MGQSWKQHIISAHVSLAGPQAHGCTKLKGGWGMWPAVTQGKAEVDLLTISQSLPYLTVTKCLLNLSLHTYYKYLV